MLKLIPAETTGTAIINIKTRKGIEMSPSPCWCEHDLFQNEVEVSCHCYPQSPYVKQTKVGNFFTIHVFVTHWHPMSNEPRLVKILQFMSLLPTGTLCQTNQGW